MHLEGVETTKKRYKNRACMLMSHTYTPTPNASIKPQPYLNTKKIIKTINKPAKFGVTSM